MRKLRIGLMIALVAVGALAIVALVGCAPTQSTTGTSTTPVKGGTFSFYIGSPAYIDPYNVQETEGAQVDHQLFTALTAFDPLDPTNLIPAAASSWSSNSDATVWTFKLNPADKFSDGNPVTAQDFVYAWNRIANPKTINTSTGKVDPSVISYYLQPVEGYSAVQAGKATTMSGLKALDNYTLQVTLSAPFGDFAYVVGNPALAPVEQSLVENGVMYNGKKVNFGDMPVGNGPFKMAEPWVQGQYIKVVRNDDYFGKQPYIDGIDFEIFSDPNTAYMAYQAGTLDFAQIGQGQIKAAEKQYGVSSDGYTANPGKQVLLGPENSVYYLVVNLKDKDLDNLNLRKAISLAIDRQSICDVVFDGTREPADNIIPPGMVGYQPGAWAFSKYDVTAAKAALVAAGYPGGAGAPEISLAYNADGGHQPIMEIVQSDLAAIGLKAKLAPTTDFPTYLNELNAGTFEIGRLGWVADYPIMDDFLYPIFSSTSADNYSKFASSTVDSAILAARKITDTSARIAAYQAIDKTIGTQMPVIPLMFYTHHHVTSSRVHGFVFSAMYMADFSNCWLSGGSGSTSTTTTP